MLDLIHAYETYLTKVKQASANTVCSYMRDIRQFTEWLQESEHTDILDATQLNISDYLSHQRVEGKSGATISRTLASLKNFYAYVISTGFLEESPVSGEIHVDRGEKKLPQILTGKEVELLLAQPSGVDAKGLRDKAMLEVMYATGIRVTELIDLNVEDVNLELGILKCTSAKKSRVIPLYPAALRALSVYLKEVRLLMVDDPGEQALFVNVGGARMSRQGFWKKFVILAAGAFMNFLTGLLIVAILFSSAGTFFVDGITGLAPEVSRTGENGLQAGDQIYKINGWRTYFSGDAQMFLSYSGDTADIEVVRNGRHILMENVARQTCTDQQGEPYQGFGLYVGRLSVPATVSNRIRYTWYQTMDFVQLVWFSLGQLVTGGAGLNDLSGPVGIVTTIKDVGTEAQETAEQNDQNGLLAAAESIAYFAALIAVNLAVMNLLPLPALDGGRIFFLLVDAVSMALFKRKVPEKYQAAINTAGFVLLMGFMLLVTFQDVFKLVK